MTIHDEIYSPIQYSIVNQNGRQVILSPEFQRLKLITQTSSAINYFPGLLHSRFQHSIGTSFLAQIILDRF